MKQPTFNGKELLPLSVMEAAHAGDAMAMERVLRYYDCLLYTSPGRGGTGRFSEVWLHFLCLLFLFFSAISTFASPQTTRKTGTFFEKMQKIKDASASLTDKRKQRMVFRHPPFLSSLAVQF